MDTPEPAPAPRRKPVLGPATILPPDQYSRYDKALSPVQHSFKPVAFEKLNQPSNTAPITVQEHLRDAGLLATPPKPWWRKLTGN